MQSNQILSRMASMRNAKTNYDVIWERANARKWSFLREDKNYNPPTMYTTVNDVAHEIIAAFDGKIEIVPKIDGVKSDLYKKLQYAYNQSIYDINTQFEREKAIKDACDYRIGVIFEGYLDKGERGKFEGLITESVDPRDFFIDDAAQVWYDPVGLRGARDCIRRRWVKVSDLKEAFKNDKYNQKAVKEVYDGMADKVNPNNSTGDHVRREVMTTETSLISIDHYSNGVIEVLEYWTCDKLVIVFNGYNVDPIYDGENPYEMLPFAVYSVMATGETMYPPSINELVAPMIQRKIILKNLMYISSKLNQIPIIYADESTDLIEGEEIKPGVRNVRLDGQDIRQKIQQLTLGGVSSSAQYMDQLLEDDLIEASKNDPKAIKNMPDVTATQVKRKIETELKNIRNIVSTMMQSAETYRAFLRCRTILKYVFADTQDLLINHVTIDREGNMKELEGALKSLFR